VREFRLRWRVPAALPKLLPGKAIESVDRRAKYLLLRTTSGTVILHLGMSGSLRLVSTGSPPTKWDHVDVELGNGQSLRFRDPRRFGALLWTDTDPGTHPLLRHLGPEPFDPVFDGRYLYQKTRDRKVASRDLLLNGRIVAGVGNIYANEALFAAGIRPQRPAGRLSQSDCDRLVSTIRETLTRAIQAGGTTLRDFHNADGLPGYFQQKLSVYGRGNEPCGKCGSRLKPIQLGQRSAVYCPKCQT